MLTRGGASVFDNITKDDLIVAFFPCIYFSCLSSLWFGLDHHDYKNWDLKRKFDYMLDRSQKRTAFFETLYKFVFICLDRCLRMIMENSWSENHLNHTSNRNKLKELWKAKSILLLECVAKNAV